eukprot:4258481-Amphidinium_carterae.1
MVGTSWDCTACGFYDFGYRTSCFKCKGDRGNAKLNKIGGPSRKPGSPAPNKKSGQPAGNTNKPGGLASKAGEPPPKSGPTASN